VRELPSRHPSKRRARTNPSVPFSFPANLTTSISPLGKAISTLLGDLDNVVGGVLETVSNILKVLDLNVNFGILGIDLDV
jgi:hypothetical protein